MDEVRNTSRRIAPQHLLDAIQPAPPLDAVCIVFANPNSTAAYLIAEAARRMQS